MQLRGPWLVSLVTFAFALTATACDDGDKANEDAVADTGNTTEPMESMGGDSEATDGTEGTEETGTTDASAEPPTEWQGETPHLEMVGSLAGQDVVATVEGDDAADVGVFYCERNYIVPDTEDPSTWAAAYLEKVEIKFNFFYMDQLAEFNVEIVHEDLPGSVGEMLPIDAATEATVQITVDPEGPNEVEFPDAGVAGNVTIGLLTGTPGTDGVVIPDGEGAFGAYLDLELESGGTLQGSFTANCGENDLEIPE